MNIDVLLDYEKKNEKALSKLVVRNGIPIWPLVRIKIMMEAISIKDGLSLPSVSGRFDGLGSLMRFIWLSFSHMHFFVGKNKLLVFSSNVVNMLHGGKYINRLYDVLKLDYGNEVVIFEDPYNKSYRRPRTVSVRYTASIKLLILIRVLFQKKATKEELCAINTFLELLRNYPVKLDDNFLMGLQRQMIKNIRYFAAMYSFYISFFKRTEPRIIIKEDASYGSSHYIFVKAAHMCGVEVVEMQHGLVYKNHPAYNFPLEKNKYFFQDGLPDYLLTFGKYWNDNIRTPAKKVIIGMDYLSKMAKQDLRNETIDMLVISDGTMPDFYKKLCTVLSCEFPDRKITLKIHPEEMMVLYERYGSLFELIDIKTVEPVYELLRRAKVVIGCQSTVMVEALAYGVTPLVYKNISSETAYSNIAFNFYIDFNDLVKKLRTNNYSNHELNIDYYWAKDPRKRIKKFFDSHFNRSQYHSNAVFIGK